MSNHNSPEGIAPDEYRCEAIVRGHPSYFWEWVRVDHRCPRRANQGRDGHAVCYIHARCKKVYKYVESSSLQDQR